MKIWKFENFPSKPYSATYQMKGNFTRIDNILLEKESDQIEKFFVKNEAKNHKFLTFFKMRCRDVFPLDSSRFVCLRPTQKCRKTRSDIILVTNLLSESSGLWMSQKYKQTILALYISISLYIQSWKKAYRHPGNSLINSPNID